MSPVAPMWYRKDGECLCIIRGDDPEIAKNREPESLHWTGAIWRAQLRFYIICSMSGSQDGPSHQSGHGDYQSCEDNSHVSPVLNFNGTYQRGVSDYKRQGTFLRNQHGSREKNKGQLSD